MAGFLFIRVRGFRVLASGFEGVDIPPPLPQILHASLAQGSVPTAGTSMPIEDCVVDEW